MWDCNRQLLPGGRGQRLAPLRGGAPVSYADVLRGWREDEGFRSYFIGLLAGAPFAAYKWETPPVTAGTAPNRAFEFVLLDAPALDQPADVTAFADPLRAAGAAGKQTVAAFPNLGHDAVLVVPHPVGPPAAYAYLAAFTRHAPTAQQHELWRAVGASMTARLNAAPVWLSTAGLGVPWLHIRLDDRPKYYGFAECRSP